MSQFTTPESLEPNSAARAPAASSGFPEELAGPLERLEALLERLTRVRLKRANAAAWDRFLSLAPESRSMIVQAWKKQAAFIEGALEQGLDAYDELGMFRYAMRHLGMLGDSELFSRVEPDDVIEILGPDYVQVYRSFTYFSLCNYSLLELSAYPFYELYDRSSVIIKKLFEHGEMIRQGKTSYVDLRDLPEYTIREVMLEAGGVFQMREKCLARAVNAATGATYLVSIKKVKEVAPPRSLTFI